MCLSPFPSFRLDLSCPAINACYSLFSVVFSNFSFCHFSWPRFYFSSALLLALLFLVKQPMQRNSQGLTNQQGFTILDPGSMSTSTTCLSTSDTKDRSPATPSTDLCPESFNNFVDPSLLSLGKSTFQSFHDYSYDVITPQGDDEYGDELPSLHSLLNLNPTSSSSDSCDTTIQKDLTEPTIRIQGWTEFPGPDAKVPVSVTGGKSSHWQRLRFPVAVQISVANAELTFLNHLDVGADV